MRYGNFSITLAHPFVLLFFTILLNDSYGFHIRAHHRYVLPRGFNRCQRTSIFAYSAGNTSFFIDTCHSFCQCFVPLSNLLSLLYLKKVNSSVILLHKNLPWPLITKKTYFYYTSPLYLYMMFRISSIVLIIIFCFSFIVIDLLSSSDTVQLTNWHSTV